MMDYQPWERMQMRKLSMSDRRAADDIKDKAALKQIWQ